MVHGLSAQEKLQVKYQSSLMKNYDRLHVSFVKGQGKYLYDSAGDKYVDFLSGIGVTSLGHCHPRINETVKKQIDNLWHVSNLYESTEQEILSQIFIDRTNLHSVFFCNSGTEANEAAIKFARQWGNGKSEIITAVGGFHGRTYGSMSASGQLKLWQGFYPLTPGFKYVPFGDLEAIENSISKNTCAIMIEPIQGENGIVVPSAGYLKAIKQLCLLHDLLFIVDEVQSGIGKTGKLFAYQHENVLPDIIASAKGIANGLPLGAVICSEKVSKVIKPGMHGSTFGGNPVSVSAAIEVMNILNEDLLNEIKEKGDYITTKLNGMNSKLIKDVRGKGLMIGIKLDEKVKSSEIMNCMLEQRFITGTAGGNVLRLLPPFIITKTDIDLFISKLKKVLDDFEIKLNIN